ncbi:MAG TPA: enoyl-CoA hydratase/isomerase family protein [Acidimicrobiales bacterium]|nr:enoyl-CoA hydratase/isomerase family protein [Acidimicrobiales bacterium]
MAEVEVSSAEGIRTVVLNRPEKRNALTLAMLEQLSSVFAEAPPAHERATVLRASGPVFCAGLDLTERRASAAPAGESPIHHLLQALRSYPLPVVAVVQGDAIAGGNELALNCDLVIASTRASFGMSLAQIGLAPSWYLAARLYDAAGPALARQMLLLGDPVPATRLAELGVILMAVPDHELGPQSDRVARRLAANAPLSLRAIKSTLVRLGEGHDGLPHGDLDALVAAAGGSGDASEGISARLERRPPDFRGR